ncbi:MAG TPA: class I SAM-dependent methyltransferase [Herpetosiphonaceae bacterium]
MQNTQSYDQQSALVHELVANTLQPNNHELLRHLGQVLGIKAQDRLLLIIGSNSDAAQQMLAEAFDCEVEVFAGDLGTLPYESEQFHSAIVTVPLTKDLHAVARELSRVLKPAGSLGMVIFSVYRDQMPEDTEPDQVLPLISTARPAAVYRAVLAECGFTAFVTKDRRRDLKRAALDSYREHMLHSSADAPVPAPDLSNQALGLLASGSVSITLITAEKGL